MYNYFIGIDFSKQTFDVTILDKNALSDKGEHKQFKNTINGMNMFERWIKKMVGKDASEQVLICGENTGIYSKVVSDGLVNHGYAMWLESALRIKRSLGISRGKDDKKDSRDIAEYAGRHADKYVPHHPLSAELEALKVLFSERRQLVNLKGSLKRRKGELKDIFNENPLLEGSCDINDKIMKEVDARIADIHKKMKEIIDNTQSLKKNYDILTSMKGVGLINAVALLIYTANFERFDYDSKKICCFWGVAPFAHTSGTSINGKPHVSSYADKYLKSLLSEAVLCAMAFCPEIAAYAHRLLAKGKHPSIVKNNCKNKMLHMLVAMVKTGTKYGENKKTQEKSENGEK